MFDRFTDRARQTMSYSRSEAERLGNDYIGPEHILLGLLKEGGGVGATVLLRAGLKLDAIQAELEKYIKTGTAVKTGQLPFTPRAKNVLEHAIDEARVMQHNYVCTEHFLIGLMREEESLAAQILMNFGLKTADVRVDVRDVLGMTGPIPEPTIDTASASLPTGTNRLVLTDSFIKVFTFARSEAEWLKHDYIGPEHILMGLAVASNVLEKLGLDAKEISRKTEAMLPTGSNPVLTGQLPFTPRGKRVLELAINEADAAKSENVTCEHLLLALLQEGESIAAKVLFNAGITLEKARQALK